MNIHNGKTRSSASNRNAQQRTATRSTAQRMCERALTGVLIEKSISLKS